MTVNKLQLPAKQNAVQEKINEIIDNLGGGGANTDLSNLTATGEAHFLKSIDSTDVINALGYTPQNSLTAVIHNANTQMGSGVNPVYVSSTGQVFSSGSTVGSGVKPVFLNAGAITVSASTVGGSSTPVYLNAGTITSTGLSIASSRFDGQWVWKYQAIENNNAKAVGSYSYTLSNYLPDTTNKYEIFVRTRAEYDSALSIYAIGTVASPADNISSSGQYFFQTYVQGNSRVAASSFILPFNANGTLYYQVKSAKLAGLAIQLCGYRRIGTNT